MTVIGEATVAVKADTKGFAADAEKGISSGLGSALKKVGAVVAAAGIGKAFASFLAGSVGEAREANKVAAQTAQVIKTTGAVANVSAAQIDSLSNALSAKSGIDDDVIASSEAVLLTFTKVRNEVGEGNDIFNQASAAALDMSVALGTDLQGATLQLGKALNDPIKGITALSRAGVSFTAEQKETIKSLVETGDVLGAQKIILGELATEFGGQAEAQATAAEKARVGWANYKEEVGKKLVPIIDALALKFSETLPGIQSATLGAFDGVGRIIRAVKPEFEALGNVIGPLKTIVGGALQTIGEVARDVFNPAFERFLPDIKDAGTSLPATTNVFGDFLDRLSGKESTINAVAVALTGLGSALVAFKVASAVGSGISAVSSGISALSSLTTVIPALANPVGLIVAGVVALAAAFTVAYLKIKPFHDLVDAVGRFFRDTVWPAVKDVASVVGGALTTAFGFVVDKLRDLWPVLQSIGGFFKGAFLTAVRAVGPVLESIGGFLTGLVSDISDAIGPISAAIGRWFGPALAKVQEVGEAFLGWLNEHVVPVIVAAGEFFAAVWTRVSEIVSTAFQVIMAVVEPIVSFLIDLLQGFVDFLLGVLGPVFDVIGGIISTAVSIWWSAVKGALDVIFSVVMAVLPTVLDIFKTVFTTIWNVIVDVFEAIKGVIEGALSIIQGIFQFFTGLLTGDWDKAWEGIKNVVSGAWEIIKSVVEGAFKQVWDVIVGAKDVLVSAFEGIWNGVKAGVSTFIDELVGFFTGIPDKLLGLVGTIGNAALAIGKAIINGIGDGLGAVGGFVSDISSKLQRALTGVLNNFVIDPINAGIRGVFTLADKVIPDFISDISGSNAPQIPRLAAGALVRARPGGTLALIAEAGRDEAVVPLDPSVRAGLQALATGGTPGGVMIDATIHVMGNVYGVEDLNAYLDQRDQRLAELLSARRGR